MHGQGLGAITDGRPVLGAVEDDPSIEHLDPPVHAAGDRAVVGDDHDGHPQAVEILEEPQDGLPGGLVQVPSGLVGQHDGRAADQCAGHCDALALPSRELVGAGTGPAVQADHGQGIEGLGPPFGLRDPGIEKAVGHVVQDALVLGQEELLEHEADPGGPQGGQFSVRELGDIEAGDPNMARARPVQAAHEVQERGLARARGSDDADQLALSDGEGDTPQGGHRRLTRIDLGHLVHFEHRTTSTVRRELTVVVVEAPNGHSRGADGHRFGTTTRCPTANADPVICTSPAASSKRPKVTATRWWMSLAPTTSTA